jgi:hypothetical protein
MIEEGSISLYSHRMLFMDLCHTCKLLLAVIIHRIRITTARIHYRTGGGPIKSKGGSYKLASSTSFLLSLSISASRATLAISICNTLEISSVHLVSRLVS